MFYDPEALVQPVRDVRFFSRRGDYTDAAPGDLYDRPWARIWEEYFEKGMKRPAAADDLGGFR